MNKSIYLNQRENLILELLAKGEKPKTIRIEVGFEKPAAYFHPYLAEIRRKTGIKDLQNRAEVRSYLSRVSALSPSFRPSIAQYAILKHIVDEMRPALSAQKLGLTEAELAEQTAATLSECAIFATDARTIRSQIRLFLATHPNPHITGKVALSPVHQEILRYMANGEALENSPLLQHLAAKNLKFLTKEACERLGIKTPGRQARQNLAKLYFAAMEAQQTPPHLPTREHYDRFFSERLAMSLDALCVEFDCSEEKAIELGKKMCARIGFEVNDKLIMKSDWVDPVTIPAPHEQTLSHEECRALWHYACGMCSVRQAAANGNFEDAETLTSAAIAAAEKAGLAVDAREKMRPFVSAMMKRLKWSPDAPDPMDDPFF